MVDESIYTKLDATLVCIGYLVLLFILFRSDALAQCLIEPETAPTSAYVDIDSNDPCYIPESDISSNDAAADTKSSIPSAAHAVSEKYGECTETDEFPISSDEIRLLAGVIYLEAGGESIECQDAVCSAILNRYFTGQYASLSDVIYAPNQYSTASYALTITPTPVQYDVINYVLENGGTLPAYVIYFRSGVYHSMSGTEDYIQIDNTFFSSSLKLKKKYEESHDISYPGQQ